MKILFYGNCQCLSMSRIIVDTDDVKTYGLECFTKVALRKEYVLSLFRMADVIVTQPIRDGYRGLDYLSTNDVFRLKRPSCRVILFNSLFFRYYYPDMKYVRIDGTTADKPALYHHTQLIEYVKQGKTKDQFMNEIVLNPSTYSSQELSSIARASIDELSKRLCDAKLKYRAEAYAYIDIASFIRQNYKKQLLFFTINHPTPVLLLHVIQRVGEILDCPLKTDSRYDFLGQLHVSILYESVLRDSQIDRNSLPRLQVGSHENVCSPPGYVDMYYNAYNQKKYNFDHAVFKNSES